MTRQARHRSSNGKVLSLMGLALTVGVLAELEQDPGGQEAYQEEFAALNRLLVSVGLPEQGTLRTERLKEV